MTREEAIEWFKNSAFYHKDHTPFNMAISALEEKPCIYDLKNRYCPRLDDSGFLKNREQEPCDDVISRQAVINAIENDCMKGGLGSCFACYNDAQAFRGEIERLPSVTQKSGKCKNCKYFEYDSVAKVDGVPLIVAHEICNKWGNGCKTSEDGYCYLFEPQESEE